MATWRELKAQGVRRCCAMLTNPATGKTRQCRRRQAPGVGSFCEKHGPIIAKATAEALKAIRAENGSN